MLSYIPQRERVSEAGAEPSREDVSEAIFGCPNGKGTAKVLKVLLEDAKDAIADAIIRFWCWEIDAEPLHEAVLIYLAKKGDLSPNNWRLICLNDIFEKLIRKLVTKRLLTMIEKYGIENQFRSPLGRGCQDGLFTI